MNGRKNHMIDEKKRQRLNWFFVEIPIIFITQFLRVMNGIDKTYTPIGRLNEIHNIVSCSIAFDVNHGIHQAAKMPIIFIQWNFWEG